MKKEFSTPEAERDYKKFKKAMDKKYKMKKKMKKFTKKEKDMLEGLKYTIEEDLSDDLWEYEQWEEKELTEDELIELWQKDLDTYESLFSKLGLKTDRAKIEKEGYKYLKAIKKGD